MGRKSERQKAEKETRFIVKKSILKEKRSKRREEDDARNKCGLPIKRFECLKREPRQQRRKSRLSDKDRDNRARSHEADQYYQERIPDGVVVTSNSQVS